MSLVSARLTARTTRAPIIQELDAGEVWQTLGGGAFATIRKISYCPWPACLLSPYITTAPDHTTANNLDNLPSC